MAKKKSMKIKVEDYFKKLAIKTFGRTADKYSKHLKHLKFSLVTANARVLFRTYLSILFFLTSFVFILTFIVNLVFSLYLQLSIPLIIIGLVTVPSFFASLTFLIIYTYPSSIAKRRKSDIEKNLPFAINHMAAVAESGAPPSTIFKVLSRFKEYGEISKDAERLVRNIEFFGLDETAALREIITKTPSSSFRDLLQGILTTIQTGGSLKRFLREELEKTMFEYRIKRERYIQQLSLYGDFYTALLIAAPLVFIIILTVLSVLGGTLFGLTMEELINLGMIVLVILNIIFLSFIHSTQLRM